MAPIVGKARDAINSLLAYTTGLRHLFHKPYTLKFPQQRYAVEEGYRGRHLLNLDRCTGCGICDWICPEKCITIVQRGDRWFPEYFYGRCCFCHFCTDSCPEFALKQTVEYDIAEYTSDRHASPPAPSTFSFTVTTRSR